LMKFSRSDPSRCRYPIWNIYMSNFRNMSVDLGSFLREEFESDKIFMIQLKLDKYLSVLYGLIWSKFGAGAKNSNNRTSKIVY
jgi:hypothetical protein